MKIVLYIMNNYQSSSTVISLYFKNSVAVMPSTERSFALTFTYSQKPGDGLIEKATFGGTTAASYKYKHPKTKVHFFEKKKSCNKQKKEEIIISPT